MRTSTVTLAFACALLAAGCAHAQQEVPRPAQTPGTMSGTIQLPRPTVYFGFDWGLQSGEHPVITKVSPGSPAARAGMVAGDRVIAVDGRDTLEHGMMFAGSAPGRRYTLRVQRGAAQHELVIVAAAPPS